VQVGINILNQGSCSNSPSRAAKHAFLHQLIQFFLFLTTNTMKWKQP